MLGVYISYCCIEMSHRAARNIPEDAKTTVLEFIADLRNGIFTGSTEQNELLLVELFYSTKPANDVIHHLVRHILPHKDQITRRDIQYFFENKETMFRGLPEERVEHFASLIERPASKGGLSDGNRKIVWEYFDVFVWLAEEHKKKC